MQGTSPSHREYLHDVSSEEADAKETHVFDTDF
jgi:hypothetical protein